MTQKSYVCIPCGSLRFVGSDCPECNRRKQTNVIIEQNDRAFRASQESERYAAEARREREYERERTQYYAQQQENERIEHEAVQSEERRKHDLKMAELSLISSESNISSDDAFNHGVDDATDFINGVTSIDITITETGKLQIHKNNNYKTSRLKKKYESGVWSVINANVDLTNVSEMLGNAAYKAGYDSYDNDRVRKYFFFVSGITIGSRNISAAGSYFCDVETVIDRSTGELELYWEPPFSEDSLNEAFKCGLEAKYSELNTPELMAERLRIDVPKIIAEERAAKFAEEKLIFEEQQALEKENANIERSRQEYLRSCEENAKNKIIAKLIMVVIYVIAPVLMMNTALHGFWVIVYMVVMGFFSVLIWNLISEIVGYKEDL